MRDDKRRDERTAWSSIEQPDGLVVEIEPAEADLVRVGRRPRSDAQRRRPALDAAIAASDEGMPQRVGGRGRFRPEVALVLVAVVFVAGALIKPWPAPAPAGSPSPIAAASPSSSIAAGPSAAIAEAQPAASYPNIRPYNYRWPFVGPSSSAAPSAPGSEVGPVAAATPQWSAVDWSILGGSDPHAGWGFTAALMPSPGANAASPTTNWVGAGSPPVYAAVPLVRGRYAYAIAVTWPSDVTVTGLKFVYLGPPQSPAYLPPEGFVTDVQVTPLPAESVSMSVVGPAATTTIPPWVRGGGGAIRSGSFWIPPSESSLSALSSSLDAAWQSSPWPWPYGAYQVTVTSASGPTNIILDLLLTT
ncbi:MAG TPA: hypothetical protein VFC12_06180 [Terriglobales bacterium]|nr:hypothetical protein [Terriglobales bacterium]